MPLSGSTERTKLSGFNLAVRSRDLPEGIIHESLQDEFISLRGDEAVMNGKDAKSDIDAPKKNPLCNLRIHELPPDTLPGGDPVPDQGVCLIECLNQPLAAQQLRGEFPIIDASVDGADCLCPGAAVDDDVESLLDVSTETCIVTLQCIGVFHRGVHSQLGIHDREMHPGIVQLDCTFTN